MQKTNEKIKIMTPNKTIRSISVYVDDAGNKFVYVQRSFVTLEHFLGKWNIVK